MSIVVSIFVFLGDWWGFRGDATVMPEGKDSWKGKGHGLGVRSEFDRIRYYLLTKRLR